MSETVSNTPEQSLNADAVIEMAMTDAEIRKLPINSEEFKAALDKMSGKTDANNESADVADTDQNEDDESSEDEDQDTQEESKPTGKKPRGMLRRIEKLVEEKHELNRKLQAYEAAQKQNVDKQVDAAVQSDFDVEKPKFKDFGSLEEYTEALTDWKIEKKEHDREVAVQKVKILEKSKEITQNWESRAAAVKKEFSDFDEVVNINSLTTVDPSQEAKIFLSESEIGPRVIYALLSDEEAVEKFAAASPVQQIKMLTKIEAQFETPSTETKKITASKAPSPPKPLPKSKPVTTGRDLMAHADEMSDGEWLRARDEYHRNKRKK